MTDQTATVYLQHLDPVGPAGVYLGDPAPDSPHFHELRRAGIGGTDVAAIVGEKPSSSARKIWHEKRGDVLPVDDETSEAGEWGVELEPTVARVWARRHHVAAGLLPGGIVCNRDAPWMRAQLDRLLAWCPDRDAQDTIICALEIKTRNQFVAGKWVDDVPDDVLAQVAWQRRVTGLDHVHVACLIGGQRLVEHTYTADVELEAYLLAAATRVWDAVLDDVPPPIEWDSLLKGLLEVLVPNRAGARELGPEEAAGLLAAWRAKQTAEDVALRMKAECEGKIKAAMGDGPDAVEALTLGGQNLFTYRSQTKRSVKLDDALAVAPELVTESAPFRVLRGPQR